MPAASPSWTRPKLTRSPLSMTASMSSSSMIVRIRAYWLAPWMSETRRKRADGGLVDGAGDVLLLEGLGHGEQVAEVGRHLRRARLDVGEQAGVALHDAEDAARAVLRERGRLVGQRDAGEGAGRGDDHGRRDEERRGGGACCAGGCSATRGRAAPRSRRRRGRSGCRRPSRPGAIAAEISSFEGWSALMSTLGRVKRLVISSRTATCTSRPGATTGEANCDVDVTDDRRRVEHRRVARHRVEPQHGAVLRRLGDGGREVRRGDPAEVAGREDREPLEHVASRGAARGCRRPAGSPPVASPHPNRTRTGHPDCTARSRRRAPMGAVSEQQARRSHGTGRRRRRSSSRC